MAAMEDCTLTRLASKNATLTPARNFPNDGDHELSDATDARAMVTVSVRTIDAREPPTTNQATVAAGLMPSTCQLSAPNAMGPLLLLGEEFRDLLSVVHAVLGDSVALDEPFVEPRDHVGRKLAHKVGEPVRPRVAKRSTHPDRQTSGDG